MRQPGSLNDAIERPSRLAKPADRGPVSIGRLGVKVFPKQRHPIRQKSESEIGVAAMLIAPGLHNLVLIVEAETEHLVWFPSDRITGRHQVLHLCQGEQQGTVLVPRGRHRLRSRWIRCVHPEE